MICIRSTYPVCSGPHYLLFGGRGRTTERDPISKPNQNKPRPSTSRVPHSCTYPHGDTNQNTWLKMKKKTNKILHYGL